MPVSREQLASTGSKSRAKRGQGKAAQASTVTSALGSSPMPIILDGREFVPGSLRFADVKRIEQRFGSAEALLELVQQIRAEAVGFLIWLSLRKSDPTLTEEELDELLPAKQMDLLEILTRVLQASGLVELDSGNEVAPASP